MGQSSYTSYYENGNLKVTGEGFFEEIRWKISAKSGLTLRESPDIKSKKIAKTKIANFKETFHFLVQTVIFMGLKDNLLLRYSYGRIYLHLTTKQITC